MGCDDQKSDSYGMSTGYLEPAYARDVRMLTIRVEKLDQELQQLRLDQAEIPRTRPLQVCPVCGHVER